MNREEKVKSIIDEYGWMTWDDKCSAAEIANDLINDHEAETTQLKERIAELESNRAFYELHKSGFLNYVGSLEAELKKKDEEESDLLAIAYLQGAGKTSRLKRFARKIYDELQELKSGVIAEFDCTARQSDTGQVFMEYVEGMYDNVQPEQTYTVTIKEKKQ